MARTWNEIIKMIEKKLKTTDGWLNIKLPTLISEVTLGQLIDMQKPLLTDIEVISILSLTPLEDLYNVRAIDDFKIFNTILVDLVKQSASVFNGQLPKSVLLEVDGVMRKVNVIDNLSVEPVGAYLAVSEIIESEQDKAKAANPDGWTDMFEPSLDAMVTMIAHYLYCPATGKDYNEKEAERFGEAVKHLPCTDALPIAKCFFLRYPHLTQRKVGFLKASQQYLKVKRGLKNLGNSDASTP